jgi:hypothetical protein
MQRKSSSIIHMNPATDCAELRKIVRQAYPDAQILPRKPFNTELTPIGEQYVVPGCEKHVRPSGSQLKLWER